MTVTRAQLEEVINRYIACKGTYPHRWRDACWDLALHCDRCGRRVGYQDALSWAQGGPVAVTNFDWMMTHGYPADPK